MKSLIALIICMLFCSTSIAQLQVTNLQKELSASLSQQISDGPIIVGTNQDYDELTSTSWWLESVYVADSLWHGSSEAFGFSYVSGEFPTLNGNGMISTTLLGDIDRARCGDVSDFLVIATTGGYAKTACDLVGDYAQRHLKVVTKIPKVEEDPLVTYEMTIYVELPAGQYIDCAFNEVTHEWDFTIAARDINDTLSITTHSMTDGEPEFHFYHHDPGPGIAAPLVVEIAEHPADRLVIAEDEQLGENYQELIIVVETYLVGSIN